jgi:hypothetical protein
MAYFDLPYHLAAIVILLEQLHRRETEKIGERRAPMTAAENAYKAGRDFKDGDFVQT